MAASYEVFTVCTCCPMPRRFILGPPSWQALCLVPRASLGGPRESRGPGGGPRSQTPDPVPRPSRGKPPRTRASSRPFPSLVTPPSRRSCDLLLLLPVSLLIPPPSLRPAVSPCRVWAAAASPPSCCDVLASTSGSDPVTVCPARPPFSFRPSPSRGRVLFDASPRCSGRSRPPYGTRQAGEFSREKVPFPSSVHTPQSSQQPPREPQQEVRERP